MIGHIVVQGDRLDTIATKYAGDPLQFWRIADANTEMDAERLTASPGRRLRIPLDISV
jgi:nucleoid-associated protein YgaU